MISRLQRLVRILADQDDAYATADDVLELVEILRDEIRKRLEFESAVLEYLEDAPGAPFAAAEALKRFILDDAGSEARVS